MTYAWLLIFLSRAGGGDPVYSNMGTYATFASCKEAHDAIEKESPVRVWAWRCVKIPR